MHSNQKSKTGFLRNALVDFAKYMYRKQDLSEKQHNNNKIVHITKKVDVKQLLFQKMPT